MVGHLFGSTDTAAYEVSQSNSQAIEHIELSVRYNEFFIDQIFTGFIKRILSGALDNIENSIIRFVGFNMFIKLRPNPISDFIIFRETLVVNILLLSKRISSLRNELVSIYNVGEVGSEWLLMNLDPVIQFFHDKNIITSG